jgi:hypothetical protein
LRVCPGRQRGQSTGADGYIEPAASKHAGSKRTRKRGQGWRRKKLVTYASSRDCQGSLPLK